MDWWYCLTMVLQGAFCFWMGQRVAEAESKNKFMPTQETWLELEKFRWIHPINEASKED